MMGSRSATMALLGLVVALGCMSEKSKGTKATRSTDAGTVEDASVLDSSTDADAGRTLPDAAIVMDAGDPLTQAKPCNGHADYCNKRYSAWCQVATHDSAANSTDFWKYPVQNQPVRSQLDNGIRALMLNVQSSSNVVSVCRGGCADGSTPLAVVLASVKDFLDANPREVVTLLIDSTLVSSQIEAEFVAKGLDALAHTQAVGAAWPTLSELIDSGRRLVVFANTADTGAAWLLPRKTFIWETATDWTSLVSMNCNLVVGDSTRPLYLVHHNLVGTADASTADAGTAGASATGGDVPGQPGVALATQANAFATVTARLQACTTQYGRAPNIVAVDYFNVGDPIGGTQVMNGVRAAQ